MTASLRLGMHREMCGVLQSLTFFFLLSQCFLCIFLRLVPVEM